MSKKLRALVALGLIGEGVAIALVGLNVTDYPFTSAVVCLIAVAASGIFIQMKL